MRQNGFVKLREPNFLGVLNHFPHRFLFEKPILLPISLVYIFVSISRRLGLNARPVAFPNKVLAMVSPPAGDAIYVDVFESESRPIVSYTSDLPAMLEDMGLNPSSLPEYASPATTSTMLLRAARNIIHSLDRVRWRNDADQTLAHDAAYCAALVLTGDARMIPTLFAGLAGPLDEVFVRNVLRPGLPEAIRDELDLRLTLQEENERYLPKINGRGQDFTGMMFRHVKYKYLGVIKGWDVSALSLSRMEYNMSVPVV
jgi:F-box protein 21